MNNFKKLAEQQGLFDRTPPSKVKDGLNRTMKLVEFIGSIVELFVPQALLVMKDMLYGPPARKPKKLKGDGLIDVKPPKYPNRIDFIHTDLKNENHAPK